MAERSNSTTASETPQSSLFQNARILDCLREMVKARSNTLKVRAVMRSRPSGLYQAANSPLRTRQ